MSTTQAPVLSGDWVPSIQANCMRTDDFWQWDYGVPSDRRLVVGGPTQSTECLPTAWNSAMTYSGSQCPPRYTEACRASTGSSAITCCPTAFDFTCPPATDMATALHASLFPCMSAHTSSGTVVVTRMFMTASDPTSTRIETQTSRPPAHLFALGIVFATSTLTTDVSSTSLSSTELPPTGLSSTGQQATATVTVPLPTATSVSSSTSLSVGTSAGIGIGAAVGVLALALLAWLAYQRRKKATRSQNGTWSPAPEAQSASTGYCQQGHWARAVSKGTLQEAP